MVTWRKMCLNVRMRVIAEYQSETVTVSGRKYIDGESIVSSL